MAKNLESIVDITEHTYKASERLNAELQSLLRSAQERMSKWPLFDILGDRLTARINASGTLSFSYHMSTRPVTTTDVAGPPARNGFDLEIKPSTVAYLLHIAIPVRHRGQGLGTELYDLSIEVAHIFGATYVEQYPSGWIGNTASSGSIPKRTRRDWLLDRGWKPCQGISRCCRHSHLPLHYRFLDTSVFKVITMSARRSYEMLIKKVAGRNDSAVRAALQIATHYVDEFCKAKGTSLSKIGVNPETCAAVADWIEERAQHHDDDRAWFLRALYTDGKCEFTL